MLVGARVAARATTQRGLVLGLGLGGCAIGLAACVPAAIPLTATTGAGWLLGGCANVAQNVCHQSLVRLRTPDAIRGRVFAASSALLIAANLLGTAAAAGVVAAVGPRWTFALAGVGAGLAGLVVVRTAKSPDSEEPGQRRARTAKSPDS